MHKGASTSRPVSDSMSSAVVWAVVKLVLAVVGSLGSLRRVLRIDPIDATTGGGS